MFKSKTLCIYLLFGSRFSQTTLPSGPTCKLSLFGLVNLCIKRMFRETEREREGAIKKYFVFVAFLLLFCLYIYIYIRVCPIILPALLVQFIEPQRRIMDQIVSIPFNVCICSKCSKLKTIERKRERQRERKRAIAFNVNQIWPDIVESLSVCEILKC